MTQLLSISAFALTLAATSFARLPDGNWSGGGTYTTDAGKKGTYTETLTIKNNTIDKAVTHDGKTWKTHSAITFDAYGFGSSQGTVTGPDGKSIAIKGEGFCADSAPVCTWHEEDAHGHFGGTSHFHKDTVGEIGCAKANKSGHKVRWEGKLKAVNLQ